MNRYTISPEETQVAVVEYSDKPVIKISLNDFKSRDTLQKALDDIQPSRGKNVATGEALKLAADKVFSSESGSRPGLPKALILITDDKPTSSDSISDASESLRRKGIPVYVVTIGGRYDPEEIKDLTPRPDHVITADEPEEVEDLAPKITYIIDENIEKSTYCIFVLFLHFT